MYHREHCLVEPLELQIDYWTAGRSSEAKEVGKGKDSNKSTLKTNFKAVQIQRIPSPGEQPGSYFLMNYITKEKKQKSKLNWELIVSICSKLLKNYAHIPIVAKLYGF